MNYPNSINDLIECYKRLPGIGEKTAERMALATLKFDEKRDVKNAIITLKMIYV